MSLEPPGSRKISTRNINSGSCWRNWENRKKPCPSCGKRLRSSRRRSRRSSNLAAVLRALGQKEEADRIVEQFRKTTDNEFRNSQLASEGNKANDLLESGKPAEAAEIYRHMLEQNPQSAWTAYNLALALEATHDAKGAEDALRKALEIDPKNAKAKAELGQLALAAGDLAIRAEVAGICAGPGPSTRGGARKSGHGSRQKGRPGFGRETPSSSP